MRVISVVLFCHFLTAFTALGMPLFLPRMLTSLGVSSSGYLIGIMFVLPTICAALTAPWWGRFADKFGKKTSLLRAQVGLVAGFLLSGFADSIWWFAAGLILQGISGGTLAASNAYLSRLFKDKELANSLNLTQSSARLALVCAPIALGLFTHIQDPLMIYRALALLPLLAFLVCWRLPDDTKLADTRAYGSTKSAAKPGKLTAKAAVISSQALNSEEKRPFSHLLWLQFLFCFAMVVTFPYFLLYSEQLGTQSDALSGFYYSLPHLVYLLFAFQAKKLTWSAKQQTQLGFALLGLACFGQFLLVESSWLIALRLLFGFGMVLIFSGLHLFVSQRISQKQAGLSFGRFDAWGKWAGVLAGVGASYASQWGSLHWPFLLAALSCGLGLLVLMFFFNEVQDHVGTTQS